MIQRFQIEDLVVQDASGVVFRALDTETNQLVAIRRFFPFGATGGGLREDEQTAYQIAVGRLAAISHPALRSVICGGCDPVDGMPFIATEWIEGTRLQTFVDRGPLSPAEAMNVLTQALEACELLSQVLAEEAVWVETGLQAIVVGAEGTGRGITFWISPLKWLGKNDGQRGLDSIITLTEEIMGWREKSVPDQAGRGLGGWLKWLRGAGKTATLHEAREMLAASIGVDPPVPTRQLVRQATRPVVIGKKKKSSGVPFLLFGVIALLAIGLGGWALVRWNDSRQQVTPALVPEQAAEIVTKERAPKSAPSVETVSEAEAPPPILGESPEDRATRRAAEFSTAAQKATQESESKTSNQQAEISKRGGVFTPADHELLIAQDDKKVTVEGTFAEIGYSKSGKTMYLQFSQNPPTSQARGSVLLKDAPADLAEAKLAPLVGKTVRLHGKIQVEKFTNRPVIVIENRNSIEVVE